jgi:hypothetical protein
VPSASVREILLTLACEQACGLVRERAGDRDTLATHAGCNRAATHLCVFRSRTPAPKPIRFPNLRKRSNKASETPPRPSDQLDLNWAGNPSGMNKPRKESIRVIQDGSPFTASRLRRPSKAGRDRPKNRLSSRPSRPKLAPCSRGTLRPKDRAKQSICGRRMTKQETCVPLIYLGTQEEKRPFCVRMTPNVRSKRAQNEGSLE